MYLIAVYQLMSTCKVNYVFPTEVERETKTNVSLFAPKLGFSTENFNVRKVQNCDVCSHVEYNFSTNNDVAYMLPQMRMAFSYFMDTDLDLLAYSTMCEQSAAARIGTVFYTDRDAQELVVLVGNTSSWENITFSYDSGKKRKLLSSEDEVQIVGNVRMYTFPLSEFSSFELLEVKSSVIQEIDTFTIIDAFDAESSDKKYSPTFAIIILFLALLLSCIVFYSFFFSIFGETVPFQSVSSLFEESNLKI